MRDYETVREQVERVSAKAQELMQRDMRVRMLVDSSAKFASDEFGPIDPDDASEAAWRIAQRAAAILYARIYDEDGELQGLTAELNLLRKRAMDVSRVFAPNLSMIDAAKS